MEGAILWWRIRTLWAVLVIPPLLHLVPVHRLAARLGRVRSSAPPFPLERVVDWVDILQRRMPSPWRFTCLKRATVLYALFRHAGISVDLCVGVRRDTDGTLAAHAWLLKEDSPYLEPLGNSIDTFQLIARFPEGPNAAEGSTSAKGLNPSA